MKETPNNKSRKTEWTKERIKKLSSDIIELQNSAIKLRDSVIKQGDSVLEVPDSIDGIRMTAEALLQVAAQQQQESEARKAEIAAWKEESDRRFYTLLDEVRYLNRRGDRTDGENQE